METCAGYLLKHCGELVSAPPNEDQRNQLVACAEIFGGACRALLKYSTALEQSSIWDTLLLPCLDDAAQKMPTAFINALFDAIRYGIHHFPPRLFHPLLKWCVAKVQSTLWQHKTKQEDVDESSKLADRFASQSKYLLLVQAILIELDADDDVGAACLSPWYTGILLNADRGNSMRSERLDESDEAEIGQSWQYVSKTLIPYLLNAIGHPYETCRDRIASLLFRMCYCHKKFLKKSTLYESDREVIDPGGAILQKLTSIRSSDEYMFKEKIQALDSARKFISKLFGNAVALDVVSAITRTYIFYSMLFSLGRRKTRVL